MKSSIRSHKDLVVWQKSIELIDEIYQITKEFPKSELHNVTSQMQRSAASIPSNIAEGRRGVSSKDFRRFIGIAYGSALELETLVIISKRLGFVPKSKYRKADRLLLEVVKMLNGLRSSLSNKTKVRHLGPKS